MSSEETVPCPTCHAARLGPCTTRSAGRARVPHVRRAVLSAALGYLAKTAARRDPLWLGHVVNHLVDGHPWDLPARAERADLGDLDERAALQTALQLQEVVDTMLGSLDGRTLDLAGSRSGSRSILHELKQAPRSAAYLHGGLQPPGGRRPGDAPPTPTEVQLWKELNELEGIRSHSRRREEAAAARWRNVGPDRWQITCFLANGCFRARRGDGVSVAGWVETPEAVPEVLRDWSIPAGGPVEVDWAEPPQNPHRRLPRWGWLPDHPENGCEDLDHPTTRPEPAHAWAAQTDGEISVFSEALHALRATWSPHDDIGGRLVAAADRLNAEEPQAPGFRLHVDPDLRLGETKTIRWIDPAAIAHTIRVHWNDFGTHRPGQPEKFTRALLSMSEDAATIAETVWACPFEPVDLVRHPGPAGPLYELGINGNHRIHTARMLKFPLIWAVITQRNLPVRISWSDVIDSDTRRRRGAIEETRRTWQGLIRHRLADADLDEDTITLHPRWVAAPWLLSPADTTVGWARNYERVYPGALATVGIPVDALESPETWRAWITGPAH